MATIKEALFQAAQRIDRFEARLLLAHLMQCRREYFITHDHDALDVHVLERFKALVTRREAGEPVPYIIGSQEFFSRPFHVRPSVLIPRPDTETLIETVLSEIARTPAKTLLDMGTGSGCIAITLALEAPQLQVMASDLSVDALTIAKENAKELNANVNFVQGAWYEALPAEARFDIIASNPPYIHPKDDHLAALEYEPIGALTDGVDGLEDLRSIIHGAPKHLNPNGLLILEHGWDQGAAVRALFDDQQWTPAQTIKDLGDNDRVTFARLKVD